MDVSNSMPFDQKDVLASNKLYLLRSLELEDVAFYYVDEQDIPNVDAKKLDVASPGKPSIHLYAL